MCPSAAPALYTERYITENQERAGNSAALSHIRVSISYRKSTREKKQRESERGRAPGWALCFDSPEPEYCCIVCFSEQRSHGCGLSDSESDAR